MSKLLNRLNEYFENTDAATQKRDWHAAVSEVKFDGPNAFEYIEFVEHLYPINFEESPQSQFKCLNNLTPKYSGSCFFSIIAQ